MTTDRAGTLAILYASQTGNAEWIAKHIHEEALARGFTSTCHALDEHAKANLSSNNALIIVASTTGDGDPPDNATKFWRWLRRAKGAELDALKGKKYAVLGLGDTNYSNFCNTAKRLERKLSDLGGASFLKAGFADDATGLEAVVRLLYVRFWACSIKIIHTTHSAQVDPWLEKLWDALASVVEYDEERAKAFAASAKKDSKLSLSKFGVAKKDEETSPNSEEKNGNADSKKDPEASATKTSYQAQAPVTASNGLDEKTPATQTPTRSESLPAESAGDRSALGNAFTPGFDKNATVADYVYSPAPLVISTTALKSTAQLTGVAKIPTEFLDVELQDERRSLEEGKSALFAILGCETITSPFDYNLSAPFKAQIASVRCLTGQRALKRVIEIELNLDGLVWDYIPGDAFGVLCPNPDELVLPVLKRLNLEPDRIVQVNAKEQRGLEGLPFRSKIPCTVYEIFRYFLDLHALPKKTFFRMLAECTHDPEEKKTLYFLASTQGAAAYRELRPQQPTLLDILHTFSTCTPPLARLLENLPRLQPRYYSVSSSPLIKPTSVSFAFNTVEYSTPAPYNKPVVGLCSTWLDGLTGKVTTQNDHLDLTASSIYIPVFPKPQPETTAPFKLPDSSETPIVMIAAGVGITPFASFLSHRQEQRKTAEASTSFGGTWLFHGRRFASPDGDGLYDSELETYVEDGTLTRFVVCLSRENQPPESVRYKYVQDGIRALGTELWNLVTTKGACIYVCGSVAMAKEVNQALADVISQVENKGVAEALGVLASLSADGRYLKDIWT